jgi:hypothetical protein
METTLRKSKRWLELAMSFWLGVGLMSLINVWKLIYTQGAIQYSWIMAGVSAVMVVICIILIKIKWIKEK